MDEYDDELSWLLDALAAANARTGGRIGAEIRAAADELAEWRSALRLDLEGTFGPDGAFRPRG